MSDHTHISVTLVDYPASAAPVLTREAMLAAIEKLRDAPLNMHGGRHDPHMFHPREAAAAERAADRGEGYLAVCASCFGLQDVAALISPRGSSTDPDGGRDEAAGADPRGGAG